MEVLLNDKVGWHKWKSAGLRSGTTFRGTEWRKAVERAVTVQTPQTTRTTVNAEVVTQHRHSARV